MQTDASGASQEPAVDVKTSDSGADRLQRLSAAANKFSTYTLSAMPLNISDALKKASRTIPELPEPLVPSNGVQGKKTGFHQPLFPDSGIMEELARRKPYEGLYHVPP